MKNMSVINPDHYKAESGREVWEQMIDVYGLSKFIAFCEVNAFKYRMRAGKKSDDIETDIKKALWYENKIKELKQEYELSNRTSITQ